MKLVLYHMYPDLLDLYGDRGNVLALKARCAWRGIDLEIRRVSLKDPLDFSRGDIIFLGGGSDREQNILVEDLSTRTGELEQAVAEGLVILAICGGYQLLGKYYQTADGQKIPGLGILDLYTVAGQKRLIGNVIAEIQGQDPCPAAASGSGGEAAATLKTLVGFENHSGRTFLGPDLKPLGQVIKGYGNNGEDGYEGVRFQNVWGTYLHGPILPKNPHIADAMIQAALKRRGYAHDLNALNDDLEKRAHAAVIRRFS